MSVLALSGRFASRLPLLSPAVTSSPDRGKSFLKGRALGIKMKFAWTAKASPFGRGGIALAMTERERTLTDRIKL